MMHRHIQDPRPNIANNPSEVFNALYLRVLAPPDLRNTQLLIQRMEDDTKREHTWLYVASHRRVRRLASGGRRETTEARGAAFFGNPQSALRSVAQQLVGFLEQGV